ncbi:MAG: DNA-processing protein DprA [Candidatus Colwellbacteria bacterium]|nr:DNA-processing protein DprA [Candidatus Colwellbacteria bacterium]
MNLLPECLRNIPLPPKNLFVSGREIENIFCGIAIVGTRKPTPEGADIAKDIAREIARAGFPVISGLAFGIDSAAHIGCLEAGGRTIAVLGSGTDRIYPESNRSLAERIIKNGGSIVSEYPPGTPPLKHQFLNRNRIIAGLSSAVIVIEAPERSGALSTASHAADSGREVLVFPGPARHRNYKGSHSLIRDGARMVTSFKDIAADLGIATKTETKNTPLPFLSPAASAVLDAIKAFQSPLSIDKLASEARLEPPEAASAITELMLEGAIVESAEGYSIK